MTSICQICGLSIDAEGFPVATPEIYSPARMSFCIGHRLQAAQMRAQIKRKYRSASEQLTDGLFRKPYKD